MLNYTIEADKSIEISELKSALDAMEKYGATKVSLTLDHLDDFNSIVVTTEKEAN